MLIITGEQAGDKAPTGSGTTFSCIFDCRSDSELGVYAPLSLNVVSGPNGAVNWLPNGLISMLVTGLDLLSNSRDSTPSSRDDERRICGFE